MITMADLIGVVSPRRQSAERRATEKHSVAPDYFLAPETARKRPNYGVSWPTSVDIR
jgi:hypothetical protein